MQADLLEQILGQQDEIKEIKRRRNQRKKKEEGEDKEEQTPNFRGIKTNSEVTEQYMSNLFEYLMQNEPEFLENLATPIVSNPLQDLIDA